MERSPGRAGVKALQWIAFTVVMIVILGWLAGVQRHKTPPGMTVMELPASPGNPVPVIVRDSPQVVQALGTVRAVQETSVGSRLLARVKKVHVTAGQQVAAGDVLVELDQADIDAQVRRLQAGVDAGKARVAQVESDLEKIRKLHASGAANPRELSDQQRAVEVAQAELRAAEEALKEAGAQLAYATVKAPITGVVIDKQIEEGDLAKPGQTLVTLYDPDRLQLVAPVPERVALGLKVGDAVGVQIDAIDLQCEAKISEIVPQATPASRALLVKVTGPCPPGVYSGMFGRMLIPQGTRQQLLVPQSAVRRVGQLEMVRVLREEVPTKGGFVTADRLVRTGQTVGDMIEVLAGVMPGESVLPRFATPPLP